MNSHSLSVGLALSAVSVFSAFHSWGAPAPSVPAQNVPRPDPVVIERGPNHRVWKTYRTITNQLGAAFSRTNSFVELSNGLHYWQGGEWKEAKEEIEIIGNNAVARHGQTQVIWAADLATAGAVEVLTADGKRLRSHVIGLSYYNAETGQSVMIAQVKSSIGKLLPPNRLFYEDAFDGVRADVVYTYLRGTFEQDVILRKRPPSPADFGLNPDTTRLEVITEFLDQPQPRKRGLKLGGEKNEHRRKLMVEPDFVDEHLDFGSFKIGRGRAFSLDGDAVGVGARPAEQHIKVGKRWLTDQGRSFLIEAVEFKAIKPGLDRLQASLPAQPKRAVAKSRQFPKRNVAMNEADDQHPSARLSASKTDEMLGASMPTGASKDKAIRTIAAVTPDQNLFNEQGFVLDYVGISSTLTDFTFHDGVTYLVTGQVYLDGTTTIKPATVVKYAPNSGLNVDGGSLAFLATPDRPAIFTALDDNSVGETLPGSTGQPNGNFYGSPAWHLAGVSGEIHDLRIQYAATAFDLSSSSVSFRNIEIFASQIGFQTDQASSPVSIKNLLMVDTGIAFRAVNQDATFSALDSTFDGIAALNQALNSTLLLHIYDSVLANVASYQTGDSASVLLDPKRVWTYQSPELPPWGTLSSNPFETGPLGNHYLVQSCQLVNASSEPASVRGLYHYTTAANQTKEFTSITDIGYHYIALSGGAPFDTDGDGLEDYVEDANGNGVFDGLETDWLNPPAPPAAGKLLNVDFASAVPTDKQGTAVVGVSSSDFWNAYSHPGAYTVTRSDLLWHDQSPAQGVVMTVNNAPGQWGYATMDVMLDGYVYSYGTPMTVTFSGLPAGTYDLYLYGHGDAASQNTKFTVSSSGGANYGTKATSAASNWASTDWEENKQYVRFAAVAIAAGENLLIQAQKDADGYYFGFNGLQILPSGGVPPGNSAPVASDAIVSLKEHSPNSTFVHGVAATDSNSSDILTYQITAASQPGVFQINPATGQITVADNSQLDYETTPQFVLTVTVTDNGSPTLSDTAIITVNLIDGNDPPVVADQTFGIPANSPNGTVVGTVQANDPNAGPDGQMTYAITSSQSAFAINPSTGSITVADTAQLNASVSLKFDLTVTVTDGGTPSLSDTATITIRIKEELGHWKFNDTANWLGEQGQTPLQAAGVREAGSWSGKAAEILPGQEIVWNPPPGILNLDFNISSNTKQGMAATGLGANDVWNRMSGNGSLAALRWSDGTSSSVNLAVNGGMNLWGMTTQDVMWSHYLYAYNGLITITFSQLPTGQYDLYLYGRGDQMDQNATFTVETPSTGVWDTRSTSENGDFDNSSVWEEGIHYVRIGGVAVNGTEDLIVRAAAGPPNGGFFGVNGLQIVPVAGPAGFELGGRLAYRTVENSGRPNLDVREGTVSLWFLPNWSSASLGGNGPGTEARLIDVGQQSADRMYGWWALVCSPDGNQIRFKAEGGGNEQTYLSAPVTMEMGTWHNIVLTYSSTGSALYVNGVQMAVGAGVGIVPSESVQTAGGFSLGSDSVRLNQVNGRFDELQTYNYVLSAGSISANYLGTISLDTDGDGLTDFWENEWGTDLANPDSDADGMPDGWEVAQGLNPLVNDASADPDDDGHVNLDEFILGQNPQVADPPLPVMTLFVQDGTLAESGADPATVLLQRDGDLNRALKVYYSLGGTARSGQDYVPLAGEVTFAPGTATMPLVIQPIDDTIHENTETVVLSLLPDPAYLYGETDTLTLELVDDELPTVNVFAADEEAGEGGDPGAFRVEREGSLTQPLTVLLTWSGSATASTDYTVSPSSVTLEIGQRSADLVVQPLQDADYEGAETVVLTLPAQAGYLIGAGTATLTIGDDDLPVVTVIASDSDAREGSPVRDGQFTFTRNATVDEPLEITFAVHGSAVPGTDYDALPSTITIPAGANSVVLPVHPIDDALGETREPVIVVLRGSSDYLIGEDHSATVFIDDNEPTTYSWELVKASTVVDSSGTLPAALPAELIVRRTGSTLAETKHVINITEHNNPLDPPAAYVYNAAPSTYNWTGDVEIYAPLYGYPEYDEVRVLFSVHRSEARIRVHHISSPYAPAVFVPVMRIYVPSLFAPNFPYKTIFFGTPDRLVSVRFLANQTTEGSSATLRFTRPPLSLPAPVGTYPQLTVPFSLDGSAALTSDYSLASPTSVTFNQNQDTVDLQLQALPDLESEGWESVYVRLDPLNPDYCADTRASEDWMAALNIGDPGLSGPPAPLDSDLDGMPDDFERLYGLNPFVFDDPYRDSDGDGFPDIEEAMAGTKPNAKDSDGDGLDDYAEWTHGSDPNDAGQNTLAPASEYVPIKLAADSCIKCHQTTLNVGQYQLTSVPPLAGMTGDNTRREQVFRFRRGQSYPVHISGPVTADLIASYTAEILPPTAGALPEFFLQDPDWMLGADRPVLDQAFTPPKHVGAKVATLIVPKVELTWEAAGGNLALDDHTNAITGQVQGKRIFVGAKTPGEATEGLTRNTVMLKIKVTPPLPGTNVFLKAFDVDDTTDNQIFDRNGEIDDNGKAGNDNFQDYLGTPKAGQFVSNNQATNMVALDANSEALVEFRVGMQPGNNHRIAATVFTTNNLASLQVTDANAALHVTADSNQVNGFNGAVSPLLTVWRKLHLEVDSMTAPPATGSEANHIETTVLYYKQAHPKPGQALMQVARHDALVEDRRFENGRIVIPGLGSYKIITSKKTVFFDAVRYWLTIETVLGAPGPAASGRTATLYDDDDAFLQTVGLPAVLPKTNSVPILISRLQPLFAPAYLLLVDANAAGWNPRQLLPFRLNEPALFPDNLFGTSMFNDVKDIGDSQVFWAHLASFGYQPSKFEDQDPDSEAVLYGGTPEVFGESHEFSVIFVESAREQWVVEASGDIQNSRFPSAIDRYWNLIAGDIAHEIGHSPGSHGAGEDHAENGMMAEATIVLQSYYPATIRRFRSAPQWSE